MKKVLAFAFIIMYSSTVNADLLEDLGKLYLIKEISKQVESKEILDIGLQDTFVKDEIDRTLRAQKIKAETIIAIEKSQIRRKIKNCINHQVRDC